MNKYNRFLHFHVIPAESNENVKICYICKEKIEHKYVKDKKIL